MRKVQTLLLLVCLCVVVLGVLAGCAPFNGTIATRDEVDRKHLLGGDLQLRMLQDDCERFLLIDRATRLSPYYARVE